MRYKIELAYVGEGFNGWQKQPNAPTVQNTLEDAFMLLFNESVDIVGCGRTDTGVHAKYYVAHFDSDHEFDLISVDKLNRYLPKTVVIKSMQKTSDDFHARFDAKNRTYKYIITTKKNPFMISFSWYIPYGLDMESMKKAALKLYEYDDFTSFSKLHTDVKTNNCKIINLNIEEKDSLIIFTITADRFLRNMVRAIVGTLVNVGKGKINIEDFCTIIENKNRGDAGQSAPAKALFLTDVTY